MLNLYIYFSEKYLIGYVVIFNLRANDFFCNESHDPVYFKSLSSNHKLLGL